jgi:hypothetical protein
MVAGSLACIQIADRFRYTPQGPAFLSRPQWPAPLAHLAGAAADIIARVPR